jgi:type 1 glutamine amidotransferase
MFLSPAARWCLLVVSTAVMAVVSSAGPAGAAPEKTKVLIVTGFDVGSHQWAESTKMIEAILQKTGRFDVTVSTDKEVFASDKLSDYAAVVLSYGFWNEADPSEDAKAGLLNYVKGGGNVVALHFACSSFQDWDEYAVLLGRVWKKGVGGHGPYGEFTVNVKNAEHPITKGMSDFKTEDELYAKLTGDAEIEVLATAYSDWSKKVEPIIFVKHYGKGRVVQNVLGHALDSKQNPDYQKLLSRCVEWAATGAVAGE